MKSVASSPFSAHRYDGSAGDDDADGLSSAAAVEPLAVSLGNDDIALESIEKCFHGYVVSEILYSANGVVYLRAIDAVRGHKVFLKACLEANHTEALTRIRHGLCPKTVPRYPDANNEQSGAVRWFSTKSPASKFLAP